MTIVSNRSRVCSELVRTRNLALAGILWVFGSMHCIPQWILRTPAQMRAHEVPVCVASAPLLMTEAVGDVSPPREFVASCIASQALRHAPAPVSDADTNLDMHVLGVPSTEFEHASGGRYVDADYSGSYFVNGAKWYDVDTRRLQIGISTNVSTNFSEHPHSAAFNQFHVYTSWVSDHTRDEGGGMGFCPEFTTCDPYPKLFGDMYDVENRHRCTCMEDVLEAVGIVDYERFICGYHLRREAVSQVDKNLCPLDWYYQTCAQRCRNPDVWDHFILLDQVSPVNFWKSTTFKKIGQYEWPGHRIGGDATFFA